MTEERDIDQPRTEEQYAARLLEAKYRAAKAAAEAALNAGDDMDERYGGPEGQAFADELLDALTAAERAVLFAPAGDLEALRFKFTIYNAETHAHRGAMAVISEDCARLAAVPARS